MHAIQGAMAVRRQRQVRASKRIKSAQQKAAAAASASNGGTAQGAGAGQGGSRRPSEMSGLSSGRSRGSSINPNSVIAAGSDGADHAQQPDPSKTETSLTAFHLGVVFILLGFLLIFSTRQSVVCKRGARQQISQQFKS